MPPNEPCPHCGQLILDWHNEWFKSAERRAIYSGQAAMDCPLCRRAVLWFEARDLAGPRTNVEIPVYRRSARLAAQWVAVRETTCLNLAGYLAHHPAGEQYRGYWQPTEVQIADEEVAKP